LNIRFEILIYDNIFIARNARIDLKSYRNCKIALDWKIDSTECSWNSLRIVSTLAFLEKSFLANGKKTLQFRWKIFVVLEFWRLFPEICCFDRGDKVFFFLFQNNYVMAFFWKWE